MKTIVNIYNKIFVHVWVLALSALIFISGIFMLTDLNNYKYVISEKEGPRYSSYRDEQGNNYINVSFDCTAKLVYEKEMHNITGWQVKGGSGYDAKSDGIYLDIYETKNGEQVFLETLHSNEYSKDFYDLEYGRGIKIVPRLENVKYEYPSWRIYVPILIFILTMPIMLLSGYLIVIKIIEKVKIKKESETPIDE